MSRMHTWLAKAASDLGLRVQVGFNVRLSCGKTIQTQAVFPDLGGESGTLVFTFQQELGSEERQELKSMGFALSTFSEPGEGEQFDLQSYAEMFRAWGWTGSLGEKPRFMR